MAMSIYQLQMKLDYSFSSNIIIRSGYFLSLIFFMLIDEGCRQKKDNSIDILWEAGIPKGIAIPYTLLQNENKAVLKSVLQVRLQNSPVDILGEYKTVVSDEVIFFPLIPLTPGKRYEIYYKKKLLGTVAVPLPDERDAPSLVSIYPSADTLPENLLKLYLQFSSPMREGEAQQHIYLLNETGDTIPDVFLDLQPELWNENSTTLTIWLDPGRIKRDLIPNQKLGNPLKTGSHYKLVVDTTWLSTKGLAMKMPVTKKFWVAGRDDESPRPADWKILLPKSNTTKPLEIYFSEPLDYFLIKEAMTIVNEKGIIVEGNVLHLKNESGVKFIPGKPWQAGNYRLKIASFLEDLAGNNLNRPFDRDIKLQKKKETDFVERDFLIK